MTLLAPTLTALVAATSLAGCTALVDTRADRREAEWAAAFPPTGQFVTVEGRRVHVLEAGRARGTAPDLVLIHGANGNLRDFTFDLVARLAGDYRILAVDRPGLGWTDSFGEGDSDPRQQARILRAALDQLGLDHPIVVGHSYGGAVAMGWALNAKDRTGAVVLLAGATYPWDGDLGLWYRLNGTVLGRPGRAMASAFVPPSAVDNVLASVFAPAPLPDGFVAHFGAVLSLRRASQAANTRQVNALNDYLTAMQPDYSALALPIEIVHGDADTIVGLQIHSRRMAADLPNAHLTVIEGGGHMPQHSHPELVVAAIRRAQRRIPGV